MITLFRFVNRRFFLIILIGLVIVSINAFLYAYNRYISFYDVGFWQNTVSNFIATFFGLFFGIPIALWINNIQQEIIDDNEKSKSNKEARQRRKLILDSLRTELNGDYELLKDYPGYTITNKSFDWLYFFSTAPSIEFWRSLSNSGELRWIEDADLLMHIAWAYHSIEQVKGSGQLFVDSAYIHPPRGGKIITKHIHEHFERNISEATGFIKAALDKIDAQN
jgi:hypothetical protein